jgi:sugar lactone lactonase YvrE
MKKFSKTIVCLVTTMMLAGSYSVHASSPGQGLRGSQNEVLSRVSTFAGSGEFAQEDGPVLSASFRTPHSIVVSIDGSILVSDSRNQLIRQIVDNDVSTYAGITFEKDELGIPQGGWSDGDKDMAVFAQPSGMSVDAEGNVYIADAGNSVIRKIASDGQVTTVAGDGFVGNQDGIGDKARFYSPQDVVVAKDGTLYVADALNHLIRKISVDGEVSTLNAPSTRTVEVVAGSIEPAGDYLDGNMQDAKFNEPSGLALDRHGNLYVSDTGNQLIRYIDFAANQVTTVAGHLQQFSSDSLTFGLIAESGYKDGSALEASFNAPKGLAITEEGGLIIADSLNHRIRYLLDGQVITLAGDPIGNHGHADGINGYNQLHNPTDVAVLQDGRILIADSYNHLIRQLILYKLPEALPLDDQVKVVLDSEVITFDIQPKIVAGYTLVPIRQIAEQMGYKLRFNNTMKSVLVTKDDISIEFQVGQSYMILSKPGMDRVTKTIVAIPTIYGSETYVPLRVLNEALGLDVQWDPNNRTVILREKG